MSFSVQLFDGAELWQVPTLDLESAAEHSRVIVCGETRPFRFLARQLKFSKEEAESTARAQQIDVLELGCSTGETTVWLAKRFRKVIGLDISQEVMDKPAGPNLDLRLMDVLADLSELDKLVETEYPSSSPPCFFVDIGGDRLEDTVLLLLQHVMQKFRPQFIVLKCRKLYRTLVAGSDELSLETRWDALTAQAVINTREERMRLHPKRFGLVLVPGTLTNQAICRYHNYLVCRKAGDCPQDHEHCHFCQQPGHRAKDCLLFATEPLFVRKG